MDHLSDAENRSHPVVITGVARGGTSLIASICAHIGIPMGKGGPRYENPYLQWAALAGRWDVVNLLAKEIGQTHALWGWKLPALVPHLETVETTLPNCRFIFVTKDVVSIAKRRASPDDGARFARLIGRTARAYEQMSRFSRRSVKPSLFISYEEAVQNPLLTATMIARFCDLPESQVAGVEQHVARDADSYRSGVRAARERTPLDKRLSKICHANGVAKPVSLYETL